jgi:anti-sigma regulatory factor (Ser/Thr protein kinase)
MWVQSQRSASQAASRVEILVPATPSVLPETRQALSELPLPAAVLADAPLMVGEMVSNSIRHAGLRADDRIRVNAVVSSGKLRVEVLNPYRTGQHRIAGGIRPAPGAESGWGLYLVESLATRWGHGTGRYWFELNL